MHNLQKYDSKEHDTILFAAAMDGTDITPAIDGERFIGYGNTRHGYGPACIVDLISTEYVAEPHVTWFPWTTRANKIVNFKWAMEYLSTSKQVFLTVEKAQKIFFDHFVKKGILRKVGYIKDLPVVEEIHMYQYKRGHNE